ncbi:MAG TPA: hypothetical protein VEM58_00670 [Streptosporangiaceae bacterium]|nr:hypothetical protein [Streptosporangiaceae bacterium]
MNRRYALVAIRALVVAGLAVGAYVHFDLVSTYAEGVAVLAALARLVFSPGR